jgi:aminomethyltransferase
LFDGRVVGPVRSGTVSPTLGYGIAMAYLPPAAEPGSPVRIVIREREVQGEVAPTPFYTEGSLRR